MMSRIFIQNLPKNISENELRKRFSQKGEITDVVLKKEKRVAFIGFKTNDEAQEAINYYDKTFIHSSKILVKKAEAHYVKHEDRKLEAENKDSHNLETQGVKRKFDPFEELKDDPEFHNFLQVQRNIDNKKGKQVWKDDNDFDNGGEEEEDKAEEKDDSGVEEEEEDEVADVPQNKRSKKTFEFTVKISNLPYKYKKRELKDFFKPIVPLSLRLPKGAKGFAFVSFKNEKDLNKALIKHKGFLNGHRILIVRQDVKPDKNNNQAVAKTDKKEPKWKSAQLPSEGIDETGRMYVRNLSYTCTEEDLRQLFSPFGVLTEVHLPIDGFTKKIKGFAFVTFMFPEHAVQAFNGLDKTNFQGRLLHLLPAHGKVDNNNRPGSQEDEGGSKYKIDKKQELKNEANNPVNWNSLFIRPNAVADIMTNKFNVNKRDLLTEGSKKDSIAVRMALGETQIVQEVRQFLVKHSVCLESFNRQSIETERSKTVLLVKNLPAETSQEEMNELFTPFGLVNRVIFPPYGITAIVEMQEPNEAKTAFRKLAYKNFKHYPLYLEWAPANIFDANGTSEESFEDKTETASAFVVDNVQHPVEDNTTIFVKNLNFTTKEEDLRNHFATLGLVYSATIAKQKTAKGILSQGYGFVQYYRATDAKEAMKQLQNTQLDGHTLELKFSNRTVNANHASVGAMEMDKRRKTNKDSKTQTQNGTKICVKNIPFEATEKDVDKLFGIYGQIKSVRLPKKLAGTSTFRGFGFVDFVTKADAKQAFEALSKSTHLYGRPLVLEWAKQDSQL